MPFAISAALLAACGDDDDDDSGGQPSPPGGTVDVVVDAYDDLRFDEDAYTVSGGEVTFEYVNEGNLVHTLVIEDVDDFKLQVNSSGDTDTGSVALEAGAYELYCDVSGHRSGGMEAVLTVE